jgi:hypothetical protein
MSAAVEKKRILTANDLSERILLLSSNKGKQKACLLPSGGNF